jgi:hypothetical protein
MGAIQPSPRPTWSASPAGPAVRAAHERP